MNLTLEELREFVAKLENEIICNLNAMNYDANYSTSKLDALQEYYDEIAKIYKASEQIITRLECLG
jgi:hypothetical protein